MKRSFFILLALFLLLVSNSHSEPISANAKDYRPVTGLEWLQMSAGERVENLLAVMYLLNKNGVEFIYEEGHYYDAIYQKIQREPRVYSSTLADILASYLYEKEPKTRPVLDRFKSEEGATAK